MKKTEYVYLKLLCDAIEEKKARFTQLGLSKELGISISTVNNALKPLERIGGINIAKRGFSIRDIEKIIIYWATKRNLEKNISYKTYVSMPIQNIEKSLPANIIYTAYSAYRLKFNDAPADYSEVIVYADAEEVKSRFPLKKGHPNLIVLKKGREIERLSKNNIAPLALVYVDLWNLGTWYAKEFLKALERRILK